VVGRRRKSEGISETKPAPQTLKIGSKADISGTGTEILPMLATFDPFGSEVFVAELAKSEVRV
jgi:hypothetical protein